MINIKGLPFNAQCLTKNYAELPLYMTDNDIDVCMISETWFWEGQSRWLYCLQET